MLAGLALTLFGLAGCEDFGGGSVTRTVTNKGTEYEVTYREAKQDEVIPLAGGGSVTETFSATFLEIRRSNGVAMKDSERRRALDIAATFCEVNRLTKAPIPASATFDGAGWEVVNYCGRYY